MSNNHTGNIQPVIDLEEHQGNLNAKRVISIDESGNAVNGPGLTPGVDFDYVDVQQTDSDTETYVFKTGGSGGTTVRTVTVNYTSATKSDIDNVTWA